MFHVEQNCINKLMFHVEHYLPIQNRLKISPKRSSAVNSQVIEDIDF